jgi:hypothetical protein
MINSLTQKTLKLVIISLLASFSAYAQVGVGTTTPSEALDVETNDGTKTAIDINNTGGGDPKINLQVGGATTFSIGIDNSDSDKLKIGTSAVETNTRVTIDATGNVGVGTTTPGAKLDVDGSAIFNESGAAVNFRIESDANANMFFVDGTNNGIGIGTATPNTAAILDLSSTTKGFAPPRLTTTQRNAIVVLLQDLAFTTPQPIVWSILMVRVGGIHATIASQLLVEEVHLQVVQLW